jgi:Uncharacterised protein family (UPF0158)
MTNTKVNFEELLDAFEFVSFGEQYSHEGYIDLETGRIHTRSDRDDLEEEEGDETWPELDDDEGRFIQIPDKLEPDLGKPLVLRFASEQLPEHADRIRAIFSKRGAYARFKDLLESLDQLENWYAYENEAGREALREWCGENGIELES